MTEVILERNGTIDKYKGDALMAFWNAPLDDADHAATACWSALDEKLGALYDLYRDRIERYEAEPPAKTGMGCLPR